MLTEHTELNRRLSERLGYQLTPGIEELTNHNRAELLSKGLEPEEVEEVLYNATKDAKASADAEHEQLATAGYIVKEYCPNCYELNEFPSYLPSGRCGACGNDIQLATTSSPVPPAPTIDEVLCKKCGGINQVPSAPFQEGRTYACIVCHAPLTTTDSHQSYIERHNELAKQQQDWQVAGGVVVLIGIIATIMYSCQAASIKYNSSATTPYESSTGQ